MKLTKKCRKTVEVTEDIICNRCGKSLVIPEVDAACGLIETTVSGGYYSPALVDCECYTFSLCEICLVDLFKQFKHFPTITNRVPFGE